MNTIHDLSDELLLNVFSLVPEERLYPCLFVCKRWKRIILDPKLLATRRYLNSKLSQIFYVMCQEIPDGLCCQYAQADHPNADRWIESILAKKRILLFETGYLCFSFRYWDLFRNLESLEIQGWTRFSDRDVKELPEDLKSLWILTSSKNFSGINFSDFPRKLESLELNREADWECCPLVTFLGLPPNLKKIGIFFRHCIGPESFKNLPRSLEEIELKKGERMKNDYIIDLPLSIRKIKFCGVSTLIRPVFLPLSQLRTLSLWSCETLEDPTIEFLPTSIRKLTLGFAPKLTDLAIQHLSQLTQLEKLSLSSCSFTGLHFNTLPSSIKKLYFFNLKHFDAKNLSGLPCKLESFVHDELKNTTLDYLSKEPLCHTLSTLSISGGMEIRPWAFQHLPCNLQTLDMKFVSVNGDDLCKLSHCTRLTILKVESIANFSKELVEALPISLKELEFGDSNWVLSESEFNALDSLPRLTHLTDLHLVFNQESLNSRLIRTIPRSVRRLNLIYRPWRNLTDEEVSHLPPHLLKIHFLTIFHEDNTSTLEKLYKKYPHLLVRK